MNQEKQVYNESQRVKSERKKEMGSRGERFKDSALLGLTMEEGVTQQEMQAIFRRQKR